MKHDQYQTHFARGKDIQAIQKENLHLRQSDVLLGGFETFNVKCCLENFK